ncbi:MAG: hypothetical protein R3A10_11480 [Caldilineaceae bacterium]
MPVLFLAATTGCWIPPRPPPAWRSSCPGSRSALTRGRGHATVNTAAEVMISRRRTVAADV